MPVAGVMKMNGRLGLGLTSGTKHLYFAYGSNLSEAQMGTRCPQARVAGTAVLPSYRLAFAGESRTWAGAGVATLRKASGKAVPGLIYEMTRVDFEALDRFEGYPRVYDRIDVELADGRHATTYLRPETDRQRCPEPAYLGLIRDEYTRLGFDMGPLRKAIRAARQADARRPCLLFVYGTLRSGQANAHYLSRARFLGHAETAPDFALVDLGPFPGLIRGGASSIRGEVYEITYRQRLSVDALEGHPDFYCRETIELAGEFSRHRVFAYFLCNNTAGGTEG